MPVTERAVIVALCAVAALVLVIWLVRTLSRSGGGPGVDVPPPLPGQPGLDPLTAVYSKYGWIDTGEPGDQVASAGPADRPPQP